MTLWVILTVMAVEFLGFALGMVLEMILALEEKYATIAILALYGGASIYMCVAVNIWLLIPLVIFAIIGKIMFPIVRSILMMDLWF
ncbi:MAG: hypothetical protein WDK95_10450 [Syntrophorhabdaceae bacterium]